MASRFHELQQTFARNPQDVETLCQLDSLLIDRGDYEAAIQAINRGLQNPAMDLFFAARLITARALCHTLLGNFSALKTGIAEATDCLLRFKGPRPERPDLINMLQYFNFLAPLSAYIAARPQLYNESTSRTIYVLGDSHILSLAHLRTRQTYFKPSLVIGVKAWHLGKPEANQFRSNFEESLKKIPAGNTVIVSAGEIDCRPREGFYPYHLKYPELSLENSIEAAVERYASYVITLTEKQQLKPVFLAVPPLNPVWLNRKDGMPSLTPEHAETCQKIIGLFNGCLAKRVSFFADSWKLAAAENGWAKPGVHLDLAHLRPDILCDAVFASGAV